jgi:hypothetical protein
VFLSLLETEENKNKKNLQKLKELNEKIYLHEQQLENKENKLKSIQASWNFLNNQG